MRKTKNVIFELSRPGRVGYTLPKSDVPKTDFKAKLPEHLVRKQPAELPEISELQLMRLVARGSDNLQIAAHLGLSDKTVRNSLSRLYGKLGVEGRPMAVVRTRELGLG